MIVVQQVDDARCLHGRLGQRTTPCRLAPSSPQLLQRSLLVNTPHTNTTEDPSLCILKLPRYCLHWELLLHLHQQAQGMLIADTLLAILVLRNTARKSFVSVLRHKLSAPFVRYSLANTSNSSGSRCLVNTLFTLNQNGHPRQNGRNKTSSPNSRNLRKKQRSALMPRLPSSCQKSKQQAQPAANG